MRAFILIAVLALVALGLEVWSRTHPVRSRSAAKMTHPFRAPHGGTIVRLGHEEFHLELVRDPVAGKLTVYILDHEAKEPIRARSTSFELIATVGGGKRPLRFTAVADPAVGSTPADATRFEAQADWLKTTPRFAAELPYLKIGTTTFLHQSLNFPEGNEKP